MERIQSTQWRAINGMELILINGMKLMRLSGVDEWVGYRPLAHLPPMNSISSILSHWLHSIIVAFSLSACGALIKEEPLLKSLFFFIDWWKGNGRDWFIEWWLEWKPITFYSVIWRVKLFNGGSRQHKSKNQSFHFPKEKWKD